MTVWVIPLAASLVGGGITAIAALFVSAKQRDHDRQMRLNEARIKAYGDVLGDSRMMLDFYLHINRYELTPADREREIESRYLAWDRSAQRAGLLCGRMVHVSLLEYQQAVFNEAEAMRARRLGELNALSAAASEKGTALAAAMRQELGVPWESVSRWRRRGKSRA